MLSSINKVGLLANLSCPTSGRNFVIDYKGLLANRDSLRGVLQYWEMTKDVGLYVCHVNMSKLGRGEFLFSNYLGHF